MKLVGLILIGIGVLAAFLFFIVVIMNIFDFLLLPIKAFIYALGIKEHDDDRSWFDKLIDKFRPFR